MTTTVQDVLDLYERACGFYQEGVVTEGELKKARAGFLATTDVTPEALDAIEAEAGVKFETVKS